MRIVKSNFIKLVVQVTLSFTRLENENEIEIKLNKVISKVTSFQFISNRNLRFLLGTKEGISKQVDVSDNSLIDSHTTAETAPDVTTTLQAQQYSENEQLEFPSKGTENVSSYVTKVLHENHFSYRSYLIFIFLYIVVFVVIKCLFRKIL